MLYDPFNRWPGKRQVIWAVLAFLAAAVFSPLLVFAVRPPSHITIDFFQEWASARNYLNGLPVYSDHRTTLPLYLGQSGLENLVVTVNAHPPTSVLLAIPFAYLDFVNARFAWNLMSLGLLAASLFMIAQGLEIPSPRWAVFPWIALLVSCGPLFMNLIWGQINLVLLFLITCSWVFDRAGRPILAGALIGLAVTIKLFPAFLFVYFLATRQWKALWSGAATIVLVTAVTIAVLGPSTYVSYVRDVIPQVAEYRSSWVNNSLYGFWAKLFDPIDRMNHVAPLWRSAITAKVGATISILAVIVVLVRTIGHTTSRTDREHAFGLSITAMLLASPITWDHYLILLPLPLATLWMRLPSTRVAQWLFLGIAIAIWVWVTPIFNLVIPGGTASGIAKPVHSLTVLSYQCYTLLILFGLGVATARTAHVDSAAVSLSVAP